MKGLGCAFAAGSLLTIAFYEAMAGHNLFACVSILFGIWNGIDALASKRDHP